MIATPAVVKFPDGQEQVVPWYEVLHLPVKRTALLTGGSGAIGGATKRLLEARGWNVIAPSKAAMNFDQDRSIWGWNDIVAHFDALIFCHGEWYSRSVLPGDIFFTHLYNQRVVFPQTLMTFLLETNSVKHVLMVSSTRGLIGGVNTAPYAAACAAQIALMQGYAREYGQGVRFNCVCPGLTEGRMGTQVIATGGAKPDAMPQAPESVAGVIVGLCEDGASNGRVVKVADGKASDMKWGEVNADR